MFWITFITAVVIGTYTYYARQQACSANKTAQAAVDTANAQRIANEQNRETWEGRRRVIFRIIWRRSCHLSVWRVSARQHAIKVGSHPNGDLSLVFTQIVGGRDQRPCTFHSYEDRGIDPAFAVDLGLGAALAVECDSLLPARPVSNHLGASLEAKALSREHQALWQLDSGVMSLHRIAETRRARVLGRVQFGASSSSTLPVCKL
jgi:hypothetical protein